MEELVILEAKKNRNKKYMQTEKGKAAKKRYRNSEKGKAAKKRYRNSEKGKATVKRYQDSEKGKATVKRYQDSEKGKATVKRYRNSKKGRAAIKKYSKNPIAKARAKELQQSQKYKDTKKKYRQSKKGKSIIKEWYSKNRIDINSKASKYHKDNNYKWDKTPARILAHRIRSMTSNRFPLFGEKCICGKDAECHHHTTIPMEFDKFIFVCYACHKLIHDELNDMEVKQNDKSR